MISVRKARGRDLPDDRPSRLTARGEMLLLQAFANHIGEILASGSGDQQAGSKRRWRASALPGRPRTPAP
jgi:hypothetical protein